MKIQCFRALCPDGQTDRQSDSLGSLTEPKKLTKNKNGYCALSVKNGCCVVVMVVLRVGLKNSVKMATKLYYVLVSMK